MTLKLFQSGGPGSGYRGHAGRPGFVGGSQAEGLAPFHPKLVERIANRLGFPVERIHTTEEEGYMFTVGDEQFRAAGDYDSKTGQVRVFDIDQKDATTVEGILAHEITHDRWYTFRKEYQRQFVEINQQAEKLGWERRKEWIVRADGSIRNPKDKEKYWAYDINDKFLTGENLEALKILDGVTPYSTAYWESISGNDSGYDTEVAINETLAEIARMEANLSDTGIDIDEMERVDPLWRDFYKEVKRGKP